jgi:hypothetical protein
MAKNKEAYINNNKKRKSICVYRIYKIYSLERELNELDDVI